ncbi:putative ribonuclease H-like domain-containing protein [Tanacetum coccineum]
MVPRIVLTRSGLISVNAVRLKAFEQITAANNSNFTKKFNTVKGTRVNTVRPIAVLSAIKGNKGNAVKASACWVWRPKHKVLDDVSRNNDFKLADERGLTCLFAKATPDESNLWHRRLGHVNFKTMNKLVRGNLVRGLPSKLFEINQTCVACQKGKQHRASCKTKTVSSISQPLQMLHMDLFGPTFVKSLMKKMYCLVVTDDFSRFSWVFFLATKDETSEILKTFITSIENLIDLRVKVIRCDNGTEFKNRVMNQFCEMKGIKREFSVARTPQQNGVAERKNRTLIEAARTMLADSKLPTTFWAEAVNTACRKPTLSFMRPFGCPIIILNTIDHLVVAGNQSNGNATTKACADVGKARVETVPDSEIPSTEEPRINQEKDASVNSTNNINTISPTVNVASIEDNVVDENIVYGCADDPNIPELEDIVYLDNDKDVGAEADMKNLDAFMPISLLACQNSQTHLWETISLLAQRLDGESVDEHLYRSMIGSLMYLTFFKADISLQYVLDYPKDSPFDLVAFTDSDYAGASLDRKSTIGGCQFLGFRLISWQCKKQIMVAHSTTEAEYITASNYCGQVLWIQNQLLDYGDSNEKKLIQMIKIHTDQNVIDLLTKAFDRMIHKGWLKWNVTAARDEIEVKTENADFVKIVDFLNANPIRYALTIHAKVKRKTIVISKSSGRRDLQFDDEDDETVTKEREDIMEMAATTVSSLEAEYQDTILGDAEAQTRFETASKQSNDPPLSRVNTLGSGEDRLKLKELMELCTKLSDRVHDLETTKTAQAKEIASLKKRVKKLERKRKPKTPEMNLFKIATFTRRSLDMDEVFKDVEGDAEHVISAVVDEVSTGDTVNTAGTEVNTASAPVTTDGVSVTTAEPITTASTLMKMRSEKSKVRGVVMQEPSKTATRPTVSPQQHDPKDNGKGKMVEQEKPLKKKDQVKFDEEIAQRLQAHMQAKLEEEERLAREREEDTNIAEWDNAQAMMDADYELAARIQA